jgi:L,D-peptidoglycan transpeptidase YkuD (ErfK/YbiS/YcfS/YnhG family)
MPIKRLKSREKRGIELPRETRLAVGGLSRRATRGWLKVGDRLLPCALGRGGRLAIKREGDGGTPIGRWPLRQIYYRSDHVRHPGSVLGVRALRRSDGWCDEPRDRNYNRRVQVPYRTSAERLWRADAVYDLVVVLGYNDCPRVRGRGSAIFLHVARPGYTPTEGCVALSRPHLLWLLGKIGRRTMMQVLA